jgi:membrane-bound serine protease (ClpP class)
MVSVGRSVYWIENDAGERKFVDEKQYKNLVTGPTIEAAINPTTAPATSQAAAWRPVPGAPNPVDDATTLLTVHTDLAKKLGLASGTATSPEALAADRDLSVVATLSPSGGERLIGWLDNGIVRFFLFLIFTQSLYAALHAPGHGFPEAIALTALGVLIGVPMLTGYAQWWEVVAIVLGLTLLALEIFVIPGFGIPGITGIVLFFYGLTMTFVGDEPGKFPVFIPTLNGTRDALTRALFIVTGGMACSLFLWFWLNRYLPKMPYFNKLILNTTVGGAETPALAGAGAIPSDAGPFVGERGEAITDLKPGGSARLDGDGRITAVVSDSGFVGAGAKLIVREVSGNRIVVRPVT